MEMDKGPLEESMTHNLLYLLVFKKSKFIVFYSGAGSFTICQPRTAAPRTAESSLRVAAVIRTFLKAILNTFFAAVS